VSSRLSALRRGSLILLVLWVAVLVGSLVQRHFRRQPQAEQPVEVEATPKEGQEQPVRVHKGFVYSDTLGIEPNFRIAAKEAVEFSSGWYEFRDVQVSLYHEGRVAYGLVADGLRYNPAKHEAQTVGHAELSLQGGVAMRASGFTLGGPGRQLASAGPVTFAGPGWGGLAGGTRSSLDKNTMELFGGVTVTWHETKASAAPSVVLLTPRITYDRKRAVADFPNGLTILRGRLEAKAHRAEMQLSQAEGELRRLTLAGPVDLSGTLDDGGNVDAHAGTTELDVLAEGHYRLTAEPLATTGWVDVIWADAAAGWRKLTAWRVVGEGTRTAWEWLEGQGLACGVELRGEAEPRRVQANRMRVAFEGGQARTVNASEAVRVETGEDWAEGGELEFSLRSKSFNLFPAEGQRVLLGSPDSTAWCDRLQGEENGKVVARGQVIGTLRGSEAMEKGKQPVRFAADAASTSADGNHLTLEGDARLWQGDRLARADELDYDSEHDIVTGRGEVLTTARAVDKNARESTIRVRARQLRYDRPAGVATYEGQVTLEDAKAEASCQSLVATMDPDGNLMLADLKGGVTIRDLTNARVITGQKARFVVGEGFFEIWGEPVLVKGPSGDQVKADHLEWQRSSNTIVVLGTEENPSETLYHPNRPKATPTPGRRTP
jgi:lipopolysaccharide export system protein LptA